MSEQAFYGRVDPNDQPQHVGAVANFTNWMGALTSIGLVLGLCVWGYKLTIRDVSEVPVIRAMAGPLRIQPADPGGETKAHQGLAVNSVQSDGAVEEPANRVVLAPEPVRLSDEDVANINLHPIDKEFDAEPLNLRDVSASSDLDAMDIDALVREAVNESRSASPVSNIASLPGVRRSPRPRARVLMASLAGGPIVLSDAAVDTNIDVDASEIPSGARLVQLGAFDDRDLAIKEWDHIIAQHGDLIGGRKRFIQVAQSGGRSFYRLRMVGFETLSDSRRLCSALLARGTPCIPVAAR